MAATKPLTVLPPEDQTTDVTATENSYIFFPSASAQRQLRQYKADRDRTRASDECNKYVSTDATLTEGIVAYYCPHRICLGFQILNRHEGPRLVFEFLYRRFAKAPAFIIYDNACTLHTYCLKREPWFFANTLFFIDNMHQPLHVRCVREYCLRHLDFGYDIISEEQLAMVREKSELGDSVPMDVITTLNVDSQVSSLNNELLKYVRTHAPCSNGSSPPMHACRRPSSTTPA